MPRGGKREGASCKAGGAKSKARDRANKAVSDGMTPLEYMLEIMRDESLPEDAGAAQIVAMKAMRFAAAKAAAPYMHPKLASVDVRGAGENGEHLFSGIKIEFVSSGNGKVS